MICLLCVIGDYIICLIIFICVFQRVSIINNDAHSFIGAETYIRIFNLDQCIPAVDATKKKYFAVGHTWICVVHLFFFSLNAKTLKQTKTRKRKSVKNAKTLIVKAIHVCTSDISQAHIIVECLYSTQL